MSRVADHRPIPVLRLQEAAEPAPPLAQKGADAARRFGACLRLPEDAKAPLEAVSDGVAAHAVNKLVVLDQAGRIETADVDKRAAPEARERAGDEEQALDLHPRIAREEVANVFIGLEPLQAASGERRLADRGDDSRDRRELGFGGEGAAHDADGLRIEQRVGIDGEKDVANAPHDGGVERSRLAAMRQAQPGERGMNGARRAQLAELRRDEAVALGEELRRRVDRAVVGNDDRVRRIRLRQQRRDRRRQHLRLVVRRDDDADAAAGARLRVELRPKEAPHVPADEALEQRVVSDVGDADRPGEQTALNECENEECDLGEENGRMDRNAAPGRRRRRQARRCEREGRRERIGQEEVRCRRADRETTQKTRSRTPADCAPHAKFRPGVK